MKLTVDRQPRSNSAEARRSELGTLLARYSIVLDEEGYLVEGRRLADGEDGENIWYAYEETNAESEWFNDSHYLDTLNKDAVQAFISTTHEAYKAAVGDEFGNAIPAIFTDEPQFAMKKRLNHANGKADVFLPWTLDLAQSYEAKYNTDLLGDLPEIFWDIRGPSKARYQFHDHGTFRLSASPEQTSALRRGSTTNTNANVQCAIASWKPSPTP